MAASLEHPNVVPIHDAGEIDGQLYIVMRLVVGSDLKVVLQAGRSSRPGPSRILEQIASALDAAHARGLVHRDVKPSNVLLDKQEHAYLADFGLSRYLGDAAASFGAGQVARHRRLRRAGADPLRRGRRPHRRLRARLPPLRNPRRRAAVPAWLGRGDAVRPARRRPAHTARPRGGAAEGPRERTGRPLPHLRGADRGRPRGARDQPNRTAAPGRSAWPPLGSRSSRPPSPASSSPEKEAACRKAFPGVTPLVRIDPETNTASERIPVGRDASALAVGSGYVWVTSFAGGDVWRIDPKSKAVLRIPTRGSPTDVAVADGQTLVVNGPQQSLTALDTQTGETRFVSTRGSPDSTGSPRVTGDGTNLWFADPTRHVVGRLSEDLQGLDSEQEIPVPQDRTSLIRAYESFDGFASGMGSLWVAGDGLGRTVWRINPTTQAVVAAIHSRSFRPMSPPARARSGSHRFWAMLSPASIRHATGSSACYAWDTEREAPPRASGRSGSPTRSTARSRGSIRERIGSWQRSRSDTSRATSRRDRTGSG